MPLDLAMGTAAITGLSVLAYTLGRRIGLRPGTPRGFSFIASLSLALLFSWTLGGRLAWAWLLPSASVIYWSNLMPALLSLTAGLAGTTPVLSRFNRPAVVGSLILLTAAFMLMPLLRPSLAPAETEPISKWHQGVCLQSHGSTCAPAAGATLLRKSSIYATESDMVQACLTSRFGTEPLGLFRGLALKSRHSGREPRVASGDPGAWERLGQFPNVALVTFERPGGRGEASSRWTPISRVLGTREILPTSREGHAIVVLGRDHRGRWKIADPAFGHATWTDEAFRARFTGDAIYMSR